MIALFLCCHHLYRNSLPTRRVLMSKQTWCYCCRKFDCFCYLDFLAKHRTSKRAYAFIAIKLKRSVAFSCKVADQNYKLVKFCCLNHFHQSSNGKISSNFLILSFHSRNFRLVQAQFHSSRFCTNFEKTKKWSALNSACLPGGHAATFVVNTALVPSQ